MPAERRFIIDIGTNSTLGLLARVDGDRLEVISDRRATTRLGEGLIMSGRLTSDAIRRTVDAAAEFTKESEFDAAFLLGTEALRLAANSDEFKGLLKSETGLDLHIISGSKEAELSFLGAIYNLHIPGDDAVLIDVGGGSTEIVIAAKGEICASTSVPIGALKLLDSLPEDTEDLFGYYTGRAIDFLMIPLSEITIPGNASIIATGGTITSVAAVSAGLKEYKPSHIHGMALTVDTLFDLAHQFEKADPLARRTLVPFDPERAELILPGLGIILAFMSIIERDSLVVSTGGLRFGAALHPEKISTEMQ